MVINIHLAGDEIKRVNKYLVNVAFAGFAVLMWTLVAYVIDLIVRSI